MPGRGQGIKGENPGIHFRPFFKRPLFSRGGRVKKKRRAGFGAKNGFRQNIVLNVTDFSYNIFYFVGSSDCWSFGII